MILCSLGIDVYDAILATMLAEGVWDMWIAQGRCWCCFAVGFHRFSEIIISDCPVRQMGGKSLGTNPQL